jgi:excisionase family DNA binding protein
VRCTRPTPPVHTRWIGQLPHTLKSLSNVVHIGQQSREHAIPIQEVTRLLFDVRAFRQDYNEVQGRTRAIEQDLQALGIDPTESNQPRKKRKKVSMGAVMTATYERVDSAMPLYLTPEQVASMLKVSPKTVYRLAAMDAGLPAARFGRAVRFRADLLERWLAARTQRSRRQIGDQSAGPTATGSSTAT